jgi:hypothetical protein
MICPKCGKNMTNTTDTKAYCMKCDMLVHLPSGVTLTGIPEQDRFIGSPAVLLGETKKNIEATLVSDSLILTWKEGKTFGHKKIAYTTMTGIQLGKRKESEVVSLEAAIIGGGILGVAVSEMSHVQTLIVSTKERAHELYMSQAADWAARLKDKISSMEPARISDKAQPVPPTKFCRKCGAKIPRESEYCEECGTHLS